MLDRTWDLLSRHLEDDTYDVMSARENAPPAAQLQALAEELQCRFPDEFLAHASGRYGGVYVAVKEELWPRPREFDVGPFWTFLWGLCTFNDAEGIPDFMDLRAMTLQFRDDTGLPLVPFLKVFGDANRYCFDRDGNIVYWEHETNEATPTGKDFFQVLEEELVELRERKDKKLASRPANASRLP